MNSWRITSAGAYPADEQVARFSIEGHIVRTARFCQDLTGHDQSLTAIHLNYPPPAYAELYEQLLPCPVHFDQSETSICLDPHKLCLPLMKRYLRYAPVTAIRS